MASSYKYCIFCSKPHSPVSCPTYPTVSRRQKRLDDLRRCYRCLKTGHMYPQCAGLYSCGICGLKDHHTALCSKYELTKDAETPSKNELCVFCEKHNNSSDCHNFRTHQSRMSRACFLNLCRICLKPCHPKRSCEAESPCKFCNAKTHHEALCPQNPQLEENYEADPSIGICTFCSNHHDPVNCPIYPTISRRRERLNKLGSCYRCLKAGHMTPQCTEYVGCGNCGNNRHHTALCCKNDLIKDAVCSKDGSCVFCNHHLNSSDCRRFPTHKGRKNRAHNLKLCRICLDKRHPNQPCQAELSPCKFCSAKTHHKALCPQNPQLEENYEADPSTGICIFCGTHNQPAQCNQRSLQVRLNLLAAEGRCQKCLRHHSTESCDYRSRCRICLSSDHHNVICPKDPYLTHSSLYLGPLLSLNKQPKLPNPFSSNLTLIRYITFEEYATLL